MEQNEDLHSPEMNSSFSLLFKPLVEGSKVSLIKSVSFDSMRLLSLSISKRRYFYASTYPFLIASSRLSHDRLCARCCGAHCSPYGDWYPTPPNRPAAKSGNKPTCPFYWRGLYFVGCRNHQCSGRRDIGGLRVWRQTNQHRATPYCSSR